MEYISEQPLFQPTYQPILPNPPTDNTVSFLTFVVFTLEDTPISLSCALIDLGACYNTDVLPIQCAPDAEEFQSVALPAGTHR